MAGGCVWGRWVHRVVAGGVAFAVAALAACGSLDDPRAASISTPPREAAADTIPDQQGASEGQPVDATAPGAKNPASEVLRDSYRPEPPALQRQGSPFRLEAELQSDSTCHKAYTFLDLSISILSLPREKPNEFYLDPLAELRRSLARLTATDQSLLALAAPVDDLIHQTEVRIGAAAAFDDILDAATWFITSSAEPGERLTRHLMDRCPGIVAFLPEDWTDTVTEGLR